MLRRKFIRVRLSQKLEFILTEQEVSSALGEYAEIIIKDLANNEDFLQKIYEALVGYGMNANFVHNVGEVEVTQLKHDAMEGTRFKIVAKPKNNEGDE